MNTSLDLAKQWLNQQSEFKGTNLVPFAAGTANTLYQLEGHDLLLRLHNQQLSMTDDCAREYATFAESAQLGLAPKLVHLDEHHRFSIIERFGRSASVLPIEAAETLLRFHQQVTESLAPRFGGATFDYPSLLLDPDRQIKAKIWQQRMLQSRLRPCWCHYDLGPGNWLVQAKSSGLTLRLIDFEYSNWGHPWWDLACLLCEWPMDEADAIVSRYLQLNQLTMTDREQQARGAAVALYLAVSLQWCDGALAQAKSKTQQQLLQTRRRHYQKLWTENGLDH